MSDQVAPAAAQGAQGQQQPEESRFQQLFSIAQVGVVSDATALHAAHNSHLSFHFDLFNSVFSSSGQSRKLVSPDTALIPV